MQTHRCGHESLIDEEQLTWLTDLPGMSSLSLHFPISSSFTPLRVIEHSLKYKSVKSHHVRSLTLPCRLINHQHTQPTALYSSLCLAFCHFLSLVASYLRVFSTISGSLHMVSGLWAWYLVIERWSTVQRQTAEEVNTPNVHQIAQKHQNIWKSNQWAQRLFSN